MRPFPAKKKLSDKEIQSVILTLETAEENHRLWLRSLHGSMICAAPFDEDVFREDAHTCCRFGKWYYQSAPELLKQLPEFLELDELHKVMHDAARYLAAKSIGQQTIYSDEYNGFIEKQQRFSQTLLAVRDHLRECLFSFDSLTGVMHRRPFSQQLDAAVARVQCSGEECCLALLDIDHFKQVNDNYGHLAGDRVLRQVAQYLISTLRPYDSICRYGGEEFLICLPSTGLEQAETIMNRSRAGLEATDIVYEPGNSLQVTASVGIARLFAEQGYDDCLGRADKALYKAKDDGRNRVCVSQ